MRDSAIHIKRSDLIEILNNVKLVDNLMLKAVKYSIRNRVLITMKSASKKKADRIIDTNSELVDQFNRIYMNIMVERDIKTMTIHKSGSMYLTLKEVTAQAKEFCDMFALGYEEGFRIYIISGVQLLGKKYSLYRLKGNAQRLVETYSNGLVLKVDETPEKTLEMYKTWQSVLKKYFNLEIDVLKDINKYVHFVHAKNDADFLKATYTDWITAQFEKWSYLNSVPEYSQLHGDNAKHIYKMFVAKYSKQFDNELEEQYFKNIENEKKIIFKADKQEASIKEARLRKSMERTGSTTDGE